jgi:murein DD-endopeptidase MepM/ murein hydrolase activator NlpD
MKTKALYLVIILSIIAIIRWIVLLLKKGNTKTDKTTAFSPVIYPATLRNDIRGSGSYNAIRFNRLHDGIDLLCTEGQNVYAPFDGTITRVTYPYGGNTRWTGLELVGDNGFTMKMFYVVPAKIGKTVKAGEVIATAQAISKKYGAGMKDHIHVELRKDNTEIDPSSYFLM